MKPVDISHLPASLKNRQDIRALAMTVLLSPCGCGYVVQSPEGKVHLVRQSSLNQFILSCDCEGAMHKGECAHILAVLKQILSNAATAPKKV